MRGRLARLFRSLHNKQEGITGLETAIILIAFVIVASVFAFVVLSTGLFSAERGNLEVRGALTVTDVDGGGAITSTDEIRFNVALAAGGFPISLDPGAYTNSVVINYIDAQAREADVTYSVNWILTDNDTLLEVGELAEITVNPPSGSTLEPNEIFTLEVIPPSGGTNLINRTMPPAIDDVMDLH